MIAISKSFLQCIHVPIFFLYFVFFSSCNDKATKNKQWEGGKFEKNTANNKFTTSNDIAFSKWFTYQSFSIEIISNNNDEQIIQYPKFSVAKTRAEDVIEIQRESIRKFLDYQGTVDKVAKANQWFETQLQAEKVLLEFVVKELLLAPEKLKELVETDEYYTDVLSRQNNLLEFIRRERDISKVQGK